MGKAYLTDLLEHEYMKWGNKKIFITAPTGMGKTTFIVEKLLPFHASGKRRVLILCNRKLLRKQYLYTFAQKFFCYSELKKCVELMTYQQLAEYVKDGTYKEILERFQVICLDEYHFFYADADFNGFGTFVLLQVLLSECIQKQMIFLSATSTEVFPLVKEAITQCITRIRVNSKYEENCEGFREVKEYDFSNYADYSRVKCVCAPDIETLCDVLGRTEKKSVIFVDDKKMAEEMCQIFTCSLKLKKQDIVVLNAENLDDSCNSKVVETLVMSNRLSPKILITTSVLDNGVSIQDADVGNVAIITESPISFLQMLGRVRAESTENLKLYFLKRKADIFAKREIRLSRTLEVIEDVQKSLEEGIQFNFFQVVWDGSNPELADVYRKIMVIERADFGLFFGKDFSVRSRIDRTRLSVNYFAKEKLGDMYLIEARMHALAMDSELKVVYEQMAWIRKSPCDLELVESTYQERQTKELKQELLCIKNFTLSELKDLKTVISEKYRKAFFADIVYKNGSFSKEKFCQILERFGMILIESIGDDGTKRYSVVEGRDIVC